MPYLHVEGDRWWHLYTAGGHRYYFDMDTTLTAQGLPCPPGEAFSHCKIAIADGSGKYPDQTSDGVLYLDKSRPIKVEEIWTDSGFVGTYGFIPLTYPDGRQTTTPQTAKIAREVAERFGMRVETA